MKKSAMLMISILIGLIGISFAVRDAMALDAPHNTNDKSWQITCSLCHYAPSQTPTWASLPTGTDTTFKNNLCTDCHQSGKLTTSQYEDIKTHSSIALNSTKYGNWTNECTTCHSPHAQAQAVTMSATNVVTDTVAAISTGSTATMSSLTAVTGGFPTDAYVGFLLVPNTNYPNRIFRITANTSNVITVTGAINPNYTAAGVTFAIRYGKMVPSYVRTPNSGQLPVKFFNTTGPDSFANGTTTGICQVCHTQTHSYKTDGTGADAVKHNEDIDQAPGGLCTKCHKHNDGFKAPLLSGCTNCHGNPPSLNIAGGPDGVVGTSATNTVYLTTGATLSAGAHVRHTTNLGMACKTCHNNSIMPSVDKQLRMQFMVNGTNYSAWTGPVVSSGSLTVFSPLTNGYTWLAGAGTTLNTSASNKSYNCSVYCHGTTISSGTNKAPSFMGGSTQAACGTCHGASTTSYPATGGHARHAGSAAGQMGLVCSNCHGAYTPAHVNGSVGWSLNTGSSLFGASAQYNGSSSGGTGQLAPSASYQTCNQIYCHSAGQSSTGGPVPTSYGTPTWSASALNCGSCHKNMNTDATAPGSHPQHVLSAGYSGTYCAICHSGYTATSVNTAVHVNNTVNTGFTSTSAAAFYTGGSTSGNTAAGGGYGTCYTSVCHGNGTGAPVWGANTTDSSCVKCHGVSGTSPAAYASDKNTSAPGYNGGRDKDGQTGTVVSFVSNDQQVGAHDVHLRALGSYATGAAITVCTDCHTLYSTATGSAAHMNGGTATMVWSSKSSSVLTPSYTGGVCSNVYCHGATFTDVNTRGTNTRPSWTVGTYLTSTAGAKNGTDCNVCHISPPVNAAKFNHSAMSITTPCTPCHGHEGTGPNHINGIMAGSGGSCTGCHDYDTGPGSWGTGTTGSGLIADATAWGAHKKHIDHLKIRNGAVLTAATDTFGGAAFNKVCGVCHIQDKAAGHGPDGGATTRQVNFNASTAHTFGSQPTPSYGWGTKSCNSLDCHFKGTPVW